MKHRLRIVLKELDVVVILILLLAVVAIFKGRTFYNLSNLFAILQLSAVLGIATIGEALVIIVRGIDVSVGAVIGFTTTLSALMIPRFGLEGAVLIPLAACAMIGLLNGVLIEKGGIPPLVTTIGMMWTVAGIAGGISGGRLISISNKSFQSIAQQGILGVVPLFFVGLFVVGLLIYFAMSNFRIGRHIYAIGGNEEAAYYSTIKVGRIRIVIYGIAAILYGIAGLLMASYIRSGMPGAGQGYEFKAMTAAVLGGVVLTGGKGNIVKAIMGAVILTTLYGVITTFAISPYLADLFQGAILVGAVYYASRSH